MNSITERWLRSTDLKIYQPIFDKIQNVIQTFKIVSVHWMGVIYRRLCPKNMQLFFEIVKGLYLRAFLVLSILICLVYALMGWKGSGHDGNIFSDAKTNGLPLREGKKLDSTSNGRLSSYQLLQNLHCADIDWRLPRVSSAASPFAGSIRLTLILIN